MSSEENKSKSEEIQRFQLRNHKFNTSSNVINEENDSNNQKIRQELKTSDLFDQKTDNPTQNNIISPSQDKNIETPIKFNLVGNDSNISTNENKKNFFNSKKINSDKKDNLDKLFCNCTKTKCIKKYCECFANNRFCKDCNCVDCMNKSTFLNNNNISNSSKELSENGEVFCTCTKSNCNKKYCECYKINKKCNEKCRCVNCLNTNYPIFNINNKDDKSNSKANSNDISNNLTETKLNDKPKIELDEKKSESIKSSLKEEDEDLDESYQIQRISIFIRQYQTTINVERFTKEDMMLLSQKRKGSK